MTYGLVSTLFHISVMPSDWDICTSIVSQPLRSIYMYIDLFCLEAWWLSMLCLLLSFCHQNSKKDLLVTLYLGFSLSFTIPLPSPTPFPCPSPFFLFSLSVSVCLSTSTLSSCRSLYLFRSTEEESFSADGCATDWFMRTAECP